MMMTEEDVRVLVAGAFLQSLEEVTASEVTEVIEDLRKRFCLKKGSPLDLYAAGFAAGMNFGLNLAK